MPKFVIDGPLPADPPKRVQLVETHDGVAVLVDGWYVISFQNGKDRPYLHSHVGSDAGLALDPKGRVVVE